MTFTRTLLFPLPPRSDAHDGGLILSASAGDLLRTTSSVHVPRFAANERFVRLHLPGELIAR